jgi:LPS export ABC transporter protein LptC
LQREAEMMPSDQSLAARSPPPPGARSSIVRMASWLALGCTLLLAFIFVYQIGTFEALRPAASSQQSEGPTADQITVSSSKVTGFDRHDQPFSIEAQAAAQDKVNPHLVHLEEVSGALKRASGETLSLRSASALYDADAKILRLNGKVRLVSGDRFVADMGRAEVTLKEKRFRSEVPVAVTFDRGEVTAKGMDITDDGNRILFFNGVKATFRPAEQGSAKP